MTASASTGATPPSSESSFRSQALSTLRNERASPSRTCSLHVSWRCGTESMSKLLAFLAAASFAAACGSSAERARQNASQGDKYAAAGQFDAAILEYRNAVKYAADS